MPSTARDYIRFVVRIRLKLYETLKGQPPYTRRGVFPKDTLSSGRLTYYLC